MMKRIFKALIYLYRQGISRYRQPRCIYIPTCSSYALEAIDRFGAIRGGLLSVWRILRCNPFSRGGYDPVPEHFTFRREYHVYCNKKRTSAAKSSLLTPYSVRLFKDDNGGN